MEDDSVAVPLLITHVDTTSGQLVEGRQKGRNKSSEGRGELQQAEGDEEREAEQGTQRSGAPRQLDNIDAGRLQSDSRFSSGSMQLAFSADDDDANARSKQSFASLFWCFLPAICILTAFVVGWSAHATFGRLQCVVDDDTGMVLSPLCSHSSAASEASIRAASPSCLSLLSPSSSVSLSCRTNLFHPFPIRQSVYDRCASLPCATFTFRSEVDGDIYAMAKYNVWVTAGHSATNKSALPTRLLPALVHPALDKGESTYLVTFICYPECSDYRVHVELAFRFVDPFHPPLDSPVFVGTPHSQSPFTAERFNMTGIVVVAAVILPQPLPFCRDGESPGYWQLIPEMADVPYEAGTSRRNHYTWHCFLCAHHRYYFNEAVGLLTAMNHRRILVAGDSVSQWWFGVLTARLGAAFLERNKTADQARNRAVELQIADFTVANTDISLHQLPITIDVSKLEKMLQVSASHISVIVLNFGFHGLAGYAPNYRYNDWMDSPLAYQHKIRHVRALLSRYNVSSRTIWRNLAITTPFADAAAPGLTHQARRISPYVELYNAITREELHGSGVRILDWYDMSASGDERAEDQIHWLAMHALNHESVDVMFDIMRQIVDNKDKGDTQRNLQTILDGVDTAKDNQTKQQQA